MFGEPSTKASNDRARSLAKRPTASSAESHEDKTFGKVITVQASTLTEAEKLAWSSSPIIKTGPMRGKELIAYRSRKLSRKFHFLLAGPSSLDKHAYDYYCLGCWNNHRGRHYSAEERVGCANCRRLSRDCAKLYSGIRRHGPGSNIGWSTCLHRSFLTAS